MNVQVQFTVHCQCTSKKKIKKKEKGVVLGVANPLILWIGRRMYNRADERQR